MDSLRRLNEYGIAVFKEFLLKVQTNADEPIPRYILTDLTASEEVANGTIRVEPKTFGTRLALAEYLYGVFTASSETALDRDPGVWVWLSLYYFDELCPAEDGKRDPGDLARWIPSGASWRYYRHLLAGPYQIYRAFRAEPEKVKISLCQPLNRPGEFVEQLASRQEFVSNPSIMEAATLLYFDLKANRPKRGAQTKGKPGTLRRFTTIVNQLDLTWDLYSTSTAELLHLLPREFNRYKPAMTTSVH